MALKSDMEIAQSASLLHICNLAQAAKIDEHYLEQYGNYKAKIDCGFLRDRESKPDGKLVLVTAINPTPAGEGKTTTTIGLADALSQIGEKSALALREPSLGPVFGVKGGAAGGGYAQIAPMDDINLHFTGDFHAIGAANNLLAALLDNHIYQGNTLNIDPRRISWRRAMDMNDRQLRFTVNGLGGKANGFPGENGFDITAASEVMAVLCLADDIDDLKKRLGRMIIAYTYEGKPITASDLNAQGAMAALLKDAMKPNLVQTLEGTPALVHGGPFANIAHGCNSIIATKMALKLGDYVITEAGFGGDLGAEKFLNIKCRSAELQPSAAVIVATVRALKYHGGMEKSRLSTPDTEALLRGIPNLLRHVKNITGTFNLPAVVAINRFPTDTKGELELIENWCDELKINFALSEVWAKGGKGGEALAREVIRLCKTNSCLSYVYENGISIKEKIHKLVCGIYHGEGASFTPLAEKQIKELEASGFGELPLCMAKTQYSFSDNPLLRCAPEGFTITVRSLKVSAGAGFIVVLTGDIMTMPGLPKIPNAEKIDVDNDGKIYGLF